MNCPCCSAELRRGHELPEPRGWIRLGDRVCLTCSWLFPREFLYEEEQPTADDCPSHSGNPPARVAVRPRFVPGHIGSPEHG
jgi:hypothetical protein